MAIVQLTDVEKTYPLGKVNVEAIKGVSLAIEAGDFISIAGPSGSGKTTILNIIGCIDTPTAGTVAISGQETSALDDKALTTLRHEYIGFIFQSFNLIPVLNMYENIEFPLLLGKGLLLLGKRSLLFFGQCRCRISGYPIIRIRRIAPIRIIVAISTPIPMSMGAHAESETEIASTETITKEIITPVIPPPCIYGGRCNSQSDSSCNS